MPLTRVDLQRLAEIRIAEAGVILANGLWDGAYYLAGYAVECGLKACIMGYVERTGIIFEDKKYSEKCWTHDIEDLAGLADLEKHLYSELSTSSTFNVNWETAKKWTETSRYARSTEMQARAMYDAITDPTHGVLTWIKRHW